MVKVMKIRYFLRTFICIFVFYGTTQVYLYAIKEYGNAGSLNYFLQEGELGRIGYVVDRPQCKILKMSPWDKAILPFITPNIPPPHCTNQDRNWAFIYNQRIHINESAVKGSGYSMASIRCCYKGILRVEQSMEEHDWNADKRVKYSEECYKIENTEEGTKVETEFSRVFCTSTSWPYFGEVVYRDFFAVALPLKETSKQKLKYWENKGQLPPSILILGIDAISRNNYHRSFLKTKEFLGQIGALEFLGYTKVGENTHPNTVAFLSGYEIEELEKICLQSAKSPQDLCPYIWKDFSEAKYLTATVEDAPELVGFNYLKLGFVQEPTDFYFRPFMLAVHKTLLRKDYYHTDCIGAETTEERVLNYIQGIMSLSSKAPVFVHSWMTSLAHLNINHAKFGDTSVSNFLSSLELSNTIVILLSDHGQRYGAIRETLAGWYEDKLPILSIYLPPTVKRRFPEWGEALRENSEGLTSPYDLYQMLGQVLNSFSNQTDDEKIKLKRKFGESLVSHISPSRSCSESGIKINYCACVPPTKLDTSDPLVLRAVSAAIKYLNGQVPSQCAEASLERVVAGGLMLNGEDSTYIVSFYTNPGQFMFEATVDYYEGSGFFNVTTDLLRMNKIIRSASCVNTSLLERYCYCN